MNECRIFQNINSITFLLYTLKKFILLLIMLKTCTSKSTQRSKWLQFTSNVTFPTAKQHIQTHAGAKLKTTLTTFNDVNAVTLQTKTMASMRIRRHLHVVDCWKFLKYFENLEWQYYSFYSKWKVGFFWWICIHLLYDSICQLWSRRQRKMAARFFLQVGHLSKVVLLWKCLLNSVQYEIIQINYVDYGKYWTFSSMQTERDNFLGI